MCPGAMAMEAANEDIVHLNSDLLLLACDSKSGRHILKLLGAQSNVIRRIAAAKSAAIGTAIRCGVPLVSFSPRLDDLLIPSTSISRGVGKQEVPEPLRHLTVQTFHVAQRLALIDRTVAQLHFGFTPRASEVFRNLSAKRILQLSEGHGVLLRLRAAAKPLVWDGLFIGERCQGPRAFRISQHSGRQNLGNE